MLKWLQHTADIVPYQYDERFTKAMMLAKVSNLVGNDNLENVKEMINAGKGFSEVLAYCINLERKTKKDAK